MNDSNRYENAKRLALALEKHSRDWGVMQQMAYRLHYDIPQLRQDIHDLASCFTDDAVTMQDIDIDAHQDEK